MRSINLLFFSLWFFSFNTQAEDVKVDASASPVVVTSDSVKKDQSVISIWASNIELGFVQTTGNTETESLNFRFAIDNKRQNWEHSLKLASVKNSDNMGTTAERYFIALKSEYKLNMFSYLFGRVQYEDDRFSGYNYQASEVVGYGRKLLNKENIKFNTEIGIGIRQNSFESGLMQTENIVVIAGDLGWTISESALLKEDLTIDIGEYRTISKSVTGLQTKINSSLSSKISYTVRHASEVPTGTKKTDTELAITLVYTFN